MGLGGYVMGIWTPRPQLNRKVEAFGNRLLARIIRPVVLTDEPDQVSRLRARSVAEWRDHLDMSLIKLWALSLARWIHHLFRHPNSHCTRLLCCQDADWLRHARALVGGSSRYGTVEAGMTCSRGETGKVVPWAGGWLEAIGQSIPLHNPFSDKGATREFAVALESLLVDGRWHGIKVLTA